MNYDVSICWIRRDIRARDHRSLAAATDQSRRVYPVFVFDPNILSKLADTDDKRISFLHASLRELDATLAKEGGGLVVLVGDPVTEIPRLAKKLGADAVFTNRDDEPYAQTRDDQVYKNLEELGCEFYTSKDTVVLERHEVLKSDGSPYRVFTPYKRAWLATLKPEDIAEAKADWRHLAPRKDVEDLGAIPDLAEIGFEAADLWLDPGEAAGYARLESFRAAIGGYKDQRNFPAQKDATSGLSVHLRHGTVSIRACVRLARELQRGAKAEGAKTWLSELIWRDFYHMILFHFPHVAKSAFREEYAKLPWPGKDEHFRLWQEGMTGFPLIDAAMRHFRATGWMHNRLRMVVASFLTKDLLIDWRRGEEYFARRLLDFDLAANNGGWQWSASTGVDAQPYFRIFNPYSQSERFDPDGVFIREHLPELAELPTKHLHRPDAAPDKVLEAANVILGKTYPKPIVDHSLQREQALALFKRAK